MKEWICAAAGTVGGLIAGLFGGWDAAMMTLLIFMIVDYATGLAVGWCGKSPKAARGDYPAKLAGRGF